MTMTTYRSLYGKIFEYEKRFENKNLFRLEGMDYDTKIFKIPKIYKYAVDLMFKHNTLTYSDFGGFDRFKRLIKKYENFRAGVKDEAESMVFVGSGLSNLVYPVVESVLNLKTKENKNEVIVFEPEYPLLESVVNKLGGKKIIVKATRENNFLVRKEDVLNSINDNTCAIIFSYPNNPTCRYQDKNFFEELVQICTKKDIFIISDEIYRDTFYNEKDYVNMASLNKGYNNFVRLCGTSKDRPGMTGMRMGYCIGDIRIENDILNNQVLRNFSGNIISEYLFMIDIALRHYNISGEKFEDFKYYPKRLIKNYIKTIKSNLRKQEKFNKKTAEFLKSNPNVIDIIEPKCGNSILFRYKKDLNPEDFLQEMMNKGIAIYPYDIFSIDEKDGSWARICITKNLKYLKKGIDLI
jgi:aspartate/methionine/tyrosine aminotransferase